MNIKISCGEDKKFVSILIFILLTAQYVDLAWAAIDESVVRVISENQLTTDKDDDIFPAWSPDGSKIAFTSNRNGNYDIFIMDYDGSNQKQLTTHPFNDFYPSWSHDGKYITFTSSQSGSSEIWIMDSDGNNQKRLTVSTADKITLFSRWIRHGNETKIAYLSMDVIDLSVISVAIMLMDPDGKNQVQMTQAMFNAPEDFDPFTRFVEFLPTWSVDGTKILLLTKTQIETTYKDLTITNVEGSNQKQFTAKYLTVNEPVWEPAWSPDGTKIAFRYGGEPYASIWIMDSNGSNRKQLTKNVKHDGYPSWSPDGTKIAFVSDRSGNLDIWIVKLSEVALFAGEQNKILDVIKQYLPYLSVAILMAFLFFFKERIELGYYRQKMRNWEKMGYDVSKLKEALDYEK